MYSFDEEDAAAIIRRLNILENVTDSVPTPPANPPPASSASASGQLYPYHDQDAARIMSRLRHYDPLRRRPTPRRPAFETYDITSQCFLTDNCISNFNS